MREISGRVALSSRCGRLVVATTVLGSAITMLTGTVVAVALPAIATDLGATSAQQQWVVNAFLLSLASLILVGGSLGDRFGRLRIYRFGVVWFAAASLVCAVAPDIDALIAARLLQGVGAALLVPGSLAIIQATLRTEDTGRGVGLWSGLSGIAAAVGPLLGGLLVALSWRWVFVINIPVALLVLLLSTRVPESKDPTAEDVDIDVVGAVLTAITLGGLSYALIGAGGRFGAVEMVCLAVAMIAATALAVYEPRREHAMLPLDLFSNRGFATANVITFLIYGGLGLVFFLLQIQLQVAAGWSPIRAGVALLPVTLIMLVLSARAGAIAQRIGPRWPLTAGPLTMAAGMVLLSRIDREATYLQDVLPAATVFGLGLAASVAPVTSAALGSVPPARSGAASGTNNAVSRTGQLLAVAAIPPAVGLSGDALSQPEVLTVGFRTAMLAAAALVGLGGLTSAVFLRSQDKPEAALRKPRYACQVDGTQVGVADLREPPSEGSRGT